MSSPLTLAFAGVRRYRKRRKNLTVVLAALFFLAFFFAIFFDAIGRNLERYWIDSFIGGDIVVSSKEGYVDLMKPVAFDRYFDWAEYSSRNAALADTSSPRLRFGGLVDSGGESGDFRNAIIVVGIDPEREQRLFGSIRMKEGTYFSGAEDEIVVPEAIAAAAGANLGDSIVLAVNTADGYLNMERAKIVGILKLPSTSFVFGNYVSYVPLSFAQRLVHTEKVSEALVRASVAGPFASVAGGDFKLFSALDCLSVSRAVVMAYGFLQVVIALLLGVFCFGIVYQNVTMMSEERFGEIGVLLTYGAKPRWIRGILFGELALYSLFCSVVGAALGSAVTIGLTLLGLYPVDMVTEVLMGGERLVLLPGIRTFVTAYLLMAAFVLAAGAGPILRATGREDIIGLFKSK